MPLWRVQAHVIPGPEVEEASEIGGAFVIGYFEREAPELATADLERVISESGWIPAEDGEFDFKQFDCEVADTENLEEQVIEALHEGQAVFFHIYPAEDEEDGQDEDND